MLSKRTHQYVVAKDTFSREDVLASMLPVEKANLTALGLVGRGRASTYEEAIELMDDPVLGPKFEVTHIEIIRGFKHVSQR